MELCIEARTEAEIAKVAKNRLWFKRETVYFPLTDEQCDILKNHLHCWDENASDCECAWCHQGNKKFQTELY